MSFLQRIYRKRRRVTEKLQALSERIAKVEDAIDKLAAERSSAAPVVIQHADKVVIERAAYSNHFGTLDIDRLSGQLNIGVNCASSADLPDELIPFAKRPKESSPGAGKPSASTPVGPTCHIRPRNKQ